MGICKTSETRGTRLQGMITCLPFECEIVSWTRSAPVCMHQTRGMGRILEKKQETILTE